jgi:hypothetical protein
VYDQLFVEQVDEATPAAATPEAGK